MQPSAPLVVGVLVASLQVERRAQAVDNGGEGSLSYDFINVAQERSAYALLS